MGVLRDRMVREMSLREFAASTQTLYLATLTELAHDQSLPESLSRRKGSAKRTPAGAPAPVRRGSVRRGSLASIRRN